MDIQAILPQINNAVNLSSNNIKCGDEFEKLLQQVNEDTDVAEMKKFLDEKFNVNSGSFIWELSFSICDSPFVFFIITFFNKKSLTLTTKKNQTFSVPLIFLCFTWKIYFYNMDMGVLFRTRRHERNMKLRKAKWNILRVRYFLIPDNEKLG